MVQQRDHLTFQTTEDTSESTHLNAPFVHKTEGLQCFMHHVLTVAFFECGPEAGLRLAACFPTSFARKSVGSDAQLSSCS